MIELTGLTITAGLVHRPDLKDTRGRAVHYPLLIFTDNNVAKNCVKLAKQAIYIRMLI